MIQLVCSNCDSKLKLKDDAAGKSLRCPKCSQSLRAPRPASAAETIGGSSSGASVAENSVTATMTIRLEDEIARGGMGAVVRGVDSAIRREIAVKFLLNQADAKQRLRFVEEAQITGQLEHPNIVPIHQLGVHADGRCFFSMKMVKGRTLGQILKDHAKKEKELPLSKLLGIFLGVCNAVGYAHSQQVIHRDLKPANVMIGDFGEVYVMDWGLAKVLGREGDAAAGPESSANITLVKTSRTQEHDTELTQAGAVVGTPAYMAPEQAAGEALDERSDIYSLGALLYEIMTLTPPVGRGGDALAVLMRVAEGEIDLPAVRAPDRARRGWVPTELAAVAMKALAKSPADRYRSVVDLKQDIERFLEGRSVSAKSDSTWEMLKKLVKRNKAVSAVAGAALVAILVSFGVILNSWQETAAAYRKYEKEQLDKTESMRTSAPAFLRAAELMMKERNFEDALAQVNVALLYDPSQTDALLTQGQLLMMLERFAEAAGPLDQYSARKPGDELARSLAGLAKSPRPERGEYYWSLAEIFEKQKNRPAVERMAQLAERFAGPQRELLAVYRKRLDAAPGWAGLGVHLAINKSGELSLMLARQPGVVDLSPLKGMKLASLDISQTPVKDLSPLEGMPLKRLDINQCPGITDLRPLRGMKLTWLSLHSLPELTDLEPLRGMPLEALHMNHCNKVASLEPLRGMPLDRLFCNGYGNMKIPSLEPLTGMKLRMLGIKQQNKLIRDLTPLKGMPLEFLEMDRIEVTSYEPLRGLPLQHLDLGASQLKDLELLKGMPLEWLSLINSNQIKDLAPLAGMKISWLSIQGLPVTTLEPLRGMPLETFYMNQCKKVTDLEPLRGMPLKTVHLKGAVQVRDLMPLAGMQLTNVSLLACDQIDDVTPLKGMPLKSLGLTPRLIRKGMDSIMDIRTIETIMIADDRTLPVDEFWRRFKTGEFAK